MQVKEVKNGGVEVEATIWGESNSTHDAYVTFYNPDARHVGNYLTLEGSGWFAEELFRRDYGTKSHISYHISSRSALFSLPASMTREMTEETGDCHNMDSDSSVNKTGDWILESKGQASSFHAKTGMIATIAKNATNPHHTMDTAIHYKIFAKLTGEAWTQTAVVSHN